MPPPMIYVFAVVAGVAAGIAFKEFVYDPHLAPKLEKWAGAYAEYRKERRRKRAPPHEHPQSHSDSGDNGDEEQKSSVELEIMVEREMENLGRDGVLRHRKFQNSDSHAAEMLEKPNAFIPYEPLSPARAPSGPTSSVQTFANRSDVALPIGRLPTPVSDHEPLSAKDTTLAQQATPSQPLATTSSASAPQHSQAVHPENEPPSPSHAFDLSFPESAPESRAPSRMASEYDFVSHTNGSAAGSRPMSPFSDLRATTPYTDVHSEVSIDSDALSSNSELLYATASDVHSLPSHASPGASPLHHGTDFLQVRPIDARSDSGSEGWERVSDAGR